MEISICLGKDDIVTYKLGNNYQVKVPNGFTIAFTPEAITELVADIKAIEDKLASEQ